MIEVRRTAEHDSFARVLKRYILRWIPQTRLTSGKPNLRIPCTRLNSVRPVSRWVKNDRPRSAQCSFANGPPGGHCSLISITSCQKIFGRSRAPEPLRRFEGPNTRASGARNSGREGHTGTP